MAEDALNLWREKLEFFQRELAVTADASLKFQLQQQIKEVQAKLAELEFEGVRPPPPPGSGFDVFLSHNSADKPTIRKIADLLQRRGLRVWLDEWELVPGRPWQQTLEEVICTTSSAAVFVGTEGIGPWEEPEMRACLSEFVDRKLPVIPVLLPNTPGTPKLPLFLRQFTLVDLRPSISDEGLDRLVWGITGSKSKTHPAVELNHTEGKCLENWESEFRSVREKITEGDESRRGSRDFNWFFGISDKTQQGVAILQDTEGRDFRIRTHHDVGGRAYKVIRCGTQNRDNIVGSNDLAALNALNRLFATFDMELEIRYDTHTYQLTDFATNFAIGLHNGVAHRICNRSDGLVEIRLEESALLEKRLKSKTAFPEFRVAGEWFNHSRTNGENDKQQKALILRVVDLRTGRVSFVCGGFDGQGTAAAGIFLGRNWQVIAKMLRDKHCQNHCAAVVIVFDRSDPFDGPAFLFKLVFRLDSQNTELALTANRESDTEAKY